jgi:hypothetical protein
MKRHVTLDQVKRELRARVCRHCPLRSPGGPGDPIDTTQPLDCEAECELFHNLPRLTEFAVRLDPMLRSVDEALQHKITQTIHSIAESRPGHDGRSSPLNRHRRCVVQTISELVDQ